ncbi:MAG: hypothetical protein EPO23_01035 [Xanthobacteraceae bacterium]|nr:MAG: hypothetical protein EPO23_01035 [Xanthobacteraceae bacterium]
MLATLLLGPDRCILLPATSFRRIRTFDHEHHEPASGGGNDCHYCVIAHGAILRIRARPRQKAVLDFAVRLPPGKK